MRFYAYCLSDEVVPEAVESAEGVGRAGVRLVRFGEVAAVVSEFEGEHVSVTRENVLAHNRVNTLVLARATPLPFRFGTLADEAGLAAYVEANRPRLVAALARVRGSVEMGVKVLGRAGTTAGSGAGDAAGAQGGAPAAGAGGGTAYLLSKRRALVAGEEARGRAEELAAWLAGRLGDAVREARVELCPSGSLLVRAAHLVERGRLADYRRRLAAARAEREGGLSFLTSGAWPPYSFTDVRPVKIFGGP